MRESHSNQYEGTTRGLSTAHVFFFLFAEHIWWMPNHCLGEIWCEMWQTQKCQGMKMMDVHNQVAISYGTYWFNDELRTTGWNDLPNVYIEVPKCLPPTQITVSDLANCCTGPTLGIWRISFKWFLDMFHWSVGVFDETVHWPWVKTLSFQIYAVLLPQ